MSEMIPNFIVVGNQPDQEVEDSFGPAVELVVMAPVVIAVPQVTVI